MKYKIEIYQYHSLIDEYETDEILELLYWWRTTHYYNYEYGNCAFATYKDGKILTFEEENELNMYDEDKTTEYKKYAEEMNNIERNKSYQARLDKVLAKFEKHNVNTNYYQLFKNGIVLIDYQRRENKFQFFNVSYICDLKLNTVESLIKDMEATNDKKN